MKKTLLTTTLLALTLFGCAHTKPSAAKLAAQKEQSQCKTINDAFYLLQTSAEQNKYSDKEKVRTFMALYQYVPTEYPEGEKYFVEELEPKFLSQNKFPDDYPIACSMVSHLNMVNLLISDIGKKSLSPAERQLILSKNIEFIKFSANTRAPTLMQAMIAVVNAQKLSANGLAYPGKAQDLTALQNWSEEQRKVFSGPWVKTKSEAEMLKTEIDITHQIQAKLKAITQT